ncbi:phosphopeptide-binding protein [Neolewinella aurantiaca]|uniref:Phosphopeptide-binding protein n=1 Tax=Neolewinella aurantiaca TaxID=2602767 RepID=A0A5C7FJW6_9BACT|nr:phosphopeptide-binding protein [Neolewinella aurantiaca]TXF91609.1 phosphopeptide-binding protein [Neolewinella aurantiaca]
MRFYSFLTFICLALLATSCGNRTEADHTSEDNAMKADDSAMTMTEGSIVDVSLEPMPATQEFQDAVISDWTYTDGKFNYETSGYEFAVPTPDADALMCANSGKGQHAHLIIDNEPYIAKYEPSFEQSIEDGYHHILTFLSRSYHESIKTPAAHRAVMASVKNGAFVKTAPISDPMLFYSRPKGTYTGKKETENVMLDFYPVNAPLGANEYQVKAVVNGKEEFMIDTWQPYYLKNLPMGENTVELTLMKDGEKVDAPLNPVTRTFTLAEAPAE